MDNNDITIEILKEIRDEIRNTNGRIDTTNTRLDQTNERLDQTNVKLGQLGHDLEGKIDHLRSDLVTRMAETEIRTATALSDVAGTMRDVRDLLRDRFDLRDRVERCERDIDELKHRVG